MRSLGFEYHGYGKYNRGRLPFDVQPAAPATPQNQSLREHPGILLSSIRRGTAHLSIAGSAFDIQRLHACYKTMISHALIIGGIGLTVQNLTKGPSQSKSKQKASKKHQKPSIVIAVMVFASQTTLAIKLNTLHPAVCFMQIAPVLKPCHSIIVILPPLGVSFQVPPQR